MKKHSQIAILLVLGSMLFTSLPTKANPIDSLISQKVCHTNYQAENYKCVKPRLKELPKDLPTVDIDWRVHKSMPYSRPVIIKDAFEGDYLAVLDQNYAGNFFWNGAQTSIVTNWSKKYVRISVISEKEVACTSICLSKPIEQVAAKVNSLQVKVGSKVFKLEGTDNQFVVTPELVDALKNAPDENAVIRITVEGGGQPVTSSIGRGTVAAWKTVYH